MSGQSQKASGGSQGEVSVLQLVEDPLPDILAPGQLSYELALPQVLNHGGLHFALATGALAHVNLVAAVLDATHQALAPAELPTLRHRFAFHLHDVAGEGYRRRGPATHGGANSTRP